MNISGKDLEKFWDSTLPVNVNSTAILRKAKEELYLENTNFFDELAFIGNMEVLDDSQDLGRTYTVNLYIPASAITSVNVITAYLPCRLRTYSPGIPYNCTIAFDDEKTMAAFKPYESTIRDLASFGSDVNKVKFMLYPYDNRVKRGAQVGYAKY